MGINPLARQPQAAGARLKETDFVKTKDGSVDFGHITHEVGEKIGRQAAPIKLQEGTDKYGKHHIDISDNGKRLKGIKEAGYCGTDDFIQDVANNFDEIRENIGSRLMLIKKNGRDRVAIIELKPGKDGDFYNVVTAGMFRKDYAKNRTLLWERVAPPLVRPEPSNSLHAITPTDTQDVNAKRLSQSNASTATIPKPDEVVKGGEVQGKRI
ncbi:MAG: hypothetical protein HQK98_11055 [Nitrospirae bacterium]|nr:hypothetical protein [Nitrospirota bacterium]